MYLSEIIDSLGDVFNKIFCQTPTNHLRWGRDKNTMTRANLCATNGLKRLNKIQNLPGICLSIPGTTVDVNVYFCMVLRKRRETILY